MSSSPSAATQAPRTVVHAGFIPLTDCAPLIIAHELGFAAGHGLSLHLHREVSWANIRDKTEAGLLDCAIMLAPMPLASTLGLGGRPPVAMIAAMATSVNGNAITVSSSLYGDMLDADPDNARAGGMAAAHSLAKVVERRRVAGLAPLTLGMVYPFSSHNYDLRDWLAAAGVDPSMDVNLVVVPPPLIADSLQAGRIDGFCAGEPWNSAAVAGGTGVIVATKSGCGAASPEKVLGLRASFSEENPDTVLRLVMTLADACAWLDVPQNRATAAALLAKPQYIGIARDVLAAALMNQVLLGTGDSRAAVADMIVFSKGDANFPWVSHAAWLLTQMIRWGQVRAPFNIAAVSRAVYCTGLYRAALAGRGIPVPEGDVRAEGGGALFETASFEPGSFLAYLNSLSMRDHSVDLAAFERAQS